MALPFPGGVGGHAPTVWQRDPPGPSRSRPPQRHGHDTRRATRRRAAAGLSAAVGEQREVEDVNATACLSDRARLLQLTQGAIDGRARRPRQAGEILLGVAASTRPHVRRLCRPPADQRNGALRRPRQRRCLLASAWAASIRIAWVFARRAARPWFFDRLSLTAGLEEGPDPVGDPHQPAPDGHALHRPRGWARRERPLRDRGT